MVFAPCIEMQLLAIIRDKNTFNIIDYTVENGMSCIVIMDHKIEHYFKLRCLELRGFEVRNLSEIRPYFSAAMIDRSPIDFKIELF